MVSVKTFKDGNRLYVCFENADVTTEDIIKNIISSAMVGKHEELPPVDAEPMIDDTSVKIPFIIPSGVYTGMTPYDVINGIKSSKEEQQVFSEINAIYPNLNPDETQNVYEVVSDYLLSRFKTIEKNLSKLNEKQKELIVSLFSLYVEGNTVEEMINNINS